MAGAFPMVFLLIPARQRPQLSALPGKLCHTLGLYNSINPAPGARVVVHVQLLARSLGG